uniref:Protein HGH1 homolog n=1 Tax=Periophthalmus magnuspinnatus TaxID=409849 RepID=A0A3B4B1Z3_9GOBI
MLSESELQELLSFLRPETRPDVKAGATECVLGLSANRDGCLLLGSKPDLLQALLRLTSDPSIGIVKDVYYTFINLSAEETLHQVLVSALNLLPLLCINLLDPSFPFSDQICTILSNLSRDDRTCRQVLQDKVGLSKLVELFCCEKFNPKATFHYIGPLLSNLSQLQEAREEILDRDRCVLQRLLPFTQFEASTIRRGGVIATLRNCCFDHSHHAWLLSDEVDLLPFLLLPLAGPEELSEEENEGLPVDLQYLPEDKQREPDSDLRRMLLETLLLLCATSRGRSVLKSRQVYALMREYHSWESTPQARSAAEKLIQILIGDEPQTGMDNLMEIPIPEEVEQKLREADAQEQEELERELNQD